MPRHDALMRAALGRLLDAIDAGPASAAGRRSARPSPHGHVGLRLPRSPVGLGFPTRLAADRAGPSSSWPTTGPNVFRSSTAFLLERPPHLRSISSLLALPGRRPPRIRRPPSSPMPPVDELRPRPSAAWPVGTSPATLGDEPSSGPVREVPELRRAVRGPTTSRPDASSLTASSIDVRDENGGRPQHNHVMAKAVDPHPVSAQADTETRSSTSPSTAEVVEGTAPRGESSPPAVPPPDKPSHELTASKPEGASGFVAPSTSAGAQSKGRASRRPTTLAEDALSNLWLAERLLPSVCDPALPFEMRLLGSRRSQDARTIGRRVLPTASQGTAPADIGPSETSQRASADTSSREAASMTPVPSGPGAVIASDVPFPPPTPPSDKKLPLIAVPILLALLLVGGLAYFLARRKKQERSGSSDGGLTASFGSSDTSGWTPPQSALERIRSLRYKFGAGPPPSLSDGGSPSRWTPLPPLPSGGGGSVRLADDSGWASAHFVRARASSVVYSTSQSLRDLPATPRSGPLRRDASAGDLSIHRQRDFRRATQILSAYELQVAAGAVDPATPVYGSPTDTDSGTEASNRADDGDGVSISSYEIICLPPSVFALAGEPVIAPSPMTPTFPPTSPPAFSSNSSSYGLHPLTPASSFGADGHGTLESSLLDANDLPAPVSPRALMRSAAEHSVRLERSTAVTEEIALVVRPTRRADAERSMALGHIPTTFDRTPTTALTSGGVSSPSSARTSVRNVLGLSIVVGGPRAGPAATTAVAPEQASSTTPHSQSSVVRPSDIVC